MKTWGGWIVAALAMAFSLGACTASAQLNARDPHGFIRGTCTGCTPWSAGVYQTPLENCYEVIFDGNKTSVAVFQLNSCPDAVR